MSKLIERVSEDLKTMISNANRYFESDSPGQTVERLEAALKLAKAIEVFRSYYLAEEMHRQKNAEAKDNGLPPLTYLMHLNSPSPQDGKTDDEYRDRVRGEAEAMQDMLSTPQCENDKDVVAEAAKMLGIHPERLRGLLQLGIFDKCGDLIPLHRMTDKEFEEYDNGKPIAEVLADYKKRIEKEDKEKQNED